MLVAFTSAVVTLVEVVGNIDNSNGGRHIIV